LRSANCTYGEQDVQSSTESTPTAATASTGSTLLPGLNQEQSRQLIQFLTNLTGGGDQKQQVPEATASTASVHMAGISYALNNTYSFCVMNQGTWILDSGASEHMSSDSTALHDLSPLNCPIMINLPDGTKVKVTHKGKLRISDTLVLHDVLLVPQFKFNLLSIKRLCQQLNSTIQFTAEMCILQAPSQKKPLAIGRDHKGLYILDKKFLETTSLGDHYTDKHSSLLHNSLLTTIAEQPTVSLDACNNVSSCVSFDVWHKRLGHMSCNKMQHVPNLVLCHNEIKDFFCEVCPKAKQHRLSFPHSKTSSDCLFQLIHVDTWGPYHTKTHTGHRYFLTIVDDYSRATWTHLMVTKDEAVGLLKAFVLMAKTQFDKNVKVIRSDNALELSRSYEVLEFFATFGITHQTSCVETPQLNGVVERKHRHLLEVSRALMFQASIPLRFWGECVLAATYLINRLPTKVLKGRTPYEKLHNSVPHYSHLRVFGCLCFVATLKQGRDKFQPRSKACVFMGYPCGQKGYKVMDIDTQKIYVSRDVIFHEDIFPFATPAKDRPLFHHQPLSCPDDTYPTSFRAPISEPPPDTPDVQPSTDHPVQLRKSSRTHTLPGYLQDYVCCTPSIQDPSFCFSTVTNLSIPDAFLFSAQESCQDHLITEPTTYAEASQHSGWQLAMNKEIQALIDNDTWEVVSLPPGKKPIACKWVYKAKYKADGSLERLKARLVVKGFTQKEGIDYLETFSPVVKMTTVRALIAVAVKRGWKLHQLDVNNAFLHGDLHEEIYMHMPEGFSTTIPRAVCRLKKSLYGLKQASRQWYAKLTEVLYSKGFQHSSNDYSLFYKKTGTSNTFLGVYVDDILLTGDDESEIDALKSHLDSAFSIKDLGEAHYFLGMEILPTPTGLFLTQRKFVRDLLAEFGNKHDTVVVCPLDNTSKLAADQGELFDNPTLYRKIVGKLNFLTNTRPDLAFAVQHLSQFMQCPRQPHFQAVQHVLRYLKGQPDLGLLFNNTAQYTIEAYCDSDWAACSHSRKSISGYVVFFGNSLISWKSKKQGTVSLSSAEAEYRSIRRLVAELAWLSRLLHELGITNITPIPVKCDSQAAIYIARNPVFHERTKHIELDCHFVREKLLAGLISLQHVHTKAQLADAFTKPLPSSLHRAILTKLGVHSTSNLRGGVGNI